MQIGGLGCIRGLFDGYLRPKTSGTSDEAKGNKCQTTKGSPLSEI